MGYRYKRKKFGNAYGFVKESKGGLIGNVKKFGNKKIKIRKIRGSFR